ncbi:MAG: hypothetical protein A6D92_14660 [Symbiobacterium thermophilum]|uniref:Uncharacterized protein n=2 Tax=Symbiobacterium thermophilum TaxID=2734 RepID=Q67RM3_SYMTH|nr:hypothetical protein [Symbiobacterium thermophilum]OTA40664.1 MAG: hypothetical protein A6D92_14660 [Symbiobacterium thermophilum]BAD39670.1 hypothetical protein STH685 [Symbiobacterium thermophilum IAM 14863]
MRHEQIIVAAVAGVFFVWYFAGAWLNRRRGAQILGAVRQAVGAVGRGATVRWHGRSAFEVAVAEPLAPLAAFRLLCLLEPRDFPLALAWNRLRGRRDQVVIHAEFARPPREGRPLALAECDIPGLTGAALSGSPPHLRLTLQVAVGGEDAIARAFALARQLAEQPPRGQPPGGVRAASAGGAAT